MKSCEGIKLTSRTTTQRRKGSIPTFTEDYQIPKIITEKIKEENRNQSRTNKMAGISLYMSLKWLNVNGWNSPMKRYILAE